MTDGPPSSALYRSTVMHHRVRPVKHRVTYKVFSLLLDVDEIPALAKKLKLFSHNHFNVLSFHDRDFGPGDGTSPRDWVEQVLADNGYDFTPGKISLLCFPRLWGYVFNPLSIYYIYDDQGVLRAVLYEVTNTYKDRHSYLLPVEGGDPIVRQVCGKNLYVSPFIGMDARYHFRLKEPGETLNVAIREEQLVDGQADGNVLFAAQSGTREDLTDKALVRAVLAHPLMTVKVTAGIHWQALRLWRKGAQAFAHGEPPANPVSATPRPRQKGEFDHDRPAIIAAE